MRKGNRNVDGRYLPADIATKRYNLSRSSLMRLADAAGATVRIGRIVRINVDVFEKYLNSQT